MCEALSLFTLSAPITKKHVSRSCVDYICIKFDLYATAWESIKNMIWKYKTYWNWLLILWGKKSCPRKEMMSDKVSTSVDIH